MEDLAAERAVHRLVAALLISHPPPTASESPRLLGSPLLADAAATLRVAETLSSSDLAEHPLKVGLQVLQDLGCAHNVSGV